MIRSMRSWTLIPVVVGGLLALSAWANAVRGGASGDPGKPAAEGHAVTASGGATDQETPTSKTSGNDPETAKGEGAKQDAPKEPQVPEVTPRPYKHLKMVQTDSGLKYWDIKVGDGEVPDPNARVKVHYGAWLADGTLLDSSVRRGFAPVYSRRGATKGFYEGVWPMRAGGIRRLEVPPELAYGPEGRGNVVPPNATIIFEVELVSVLQPPQQTSVEGITPVVTESGLKYWDLKVGEGTKPMLRAHVSVHYTGWFADGMLFESTANLQEPISLRLDGLVSGFAEGIASMRVGGKRRLEIPKELAFGTQAAIFEVELFAVTPPPPTPKPEPITAGVEPVSTPSGLSYWDMTPGHGRSPDASAMVSVHLTGWLEDGSMYLNTREGRRPYTFNLKDEIKGLAEGVGSMKVGGKRRLKIPPVLAYGKQGKPGAIPPNATLIVDVELSGFRN